MGANQTRRFFELINTHQRHLPFDRVFHDFSLIGHGQAVKGFIQQAIR